MKVGLIGLGIIGSRVAAKLAEAGSLHTVYNRTLAKAEAYRAGSTVHRSETIHELVRECEVIVTVLSDDDAVQALYGGLSTVSVEGKTFLEMSTIAPLDLRGDRRAAQAKGSIDAGRSRRWVGERGREERNRPPGRRRNERLRG